MFTGVQVCDLRLWLESEISCVIDCPLGSLRVQKMEFEIYLSNAPVKCNGLPSNSVCVGGLSWNDDEVQPSLFVLAALLNCFLLQSYSFFGTPMRMHIATAIMKSLISELFTPFRARKALPIL